MQYAVMIIYVLLSVSGLVCFKLGYSEGLIFRITQYNFQLKVSWLCILGLILYAISFLTYMGLVAKNQLSYMLPVVTGAVYILTILSSVIIFKETLGTQQVLGGVFILAGIVLINIKI